MAGGSMSVIGPWLRRPLTIPPNSPGAWLRLAVWEMWMGMLLCVILALSVNLIATAPERIFAVTDFSRCYGPPPVALPCEVVVYRSGLLNAAFTALCGVMMIGLAAWFLWELWTAVEPKPITDDFLRLLDDSFGRDWRNPLTWPWARVMWAYGFTAVGATMAMAVGVIVWTLVTSVAEAPTIKIETSQTFRLGQ